MKKFLKYFGYTLLGAIVLAYAGFLFVLPNVIDLNQYIPEVKKLAKEQSNLDVNIENVKVVTTPLLGAGIKTDNISVKLPDGSTIFSADSLKTRISLPSLFLLTVKVSCLEVENPVVNLEISKDKLKVISYVEDLLNADKEQRLENGKEIVETQEEGSFQFNPAWIKIKVPCVKLKNYKVLVKDLNSKHFLDLHGEELKLGYFNGKTAKIKTYAELFSDENKNITANIDITTFLPAPVETLDSEDDPAERIEINIPNPVTMYRNYDLKANLDTKLRIRNNKDNITSYGYFNVENATLKIAHLQLPESYLRANTFGTTVNLDTNIYPMKDENIQLLGKLNYSNHPKMDMNIKTSDIKFNDLLILAKATLDSLSIKNELSQIKAQGVFNADCYIKTNFKKLKSSGVIIVKDGGISVRNIGNVLSKANINIKLDENVLDIRNSSLLVGNSPINIDGKIDEKSVADINVKATKIPLPILFNAFAPKELRQAYNFKSGNLSLDLGIKGHLKESLASAKFGIENLNISDKSMVISNQQLLAEFSCGGKCKFGQTIADTIKGKIENNNFGLFLNQTKSKLSVPKLEVEIANDNVIIKENDILFNDKSKLSYSGEVIDYNKLESIKFLVNGGLNTDDLIKLIGREFKPYIHSQGTVPVKVTLDGNNKKQTVFVQALADKDNFITPVDFNNVLGQNTSLQSVVDLKQGRIKIKKTGLFTRNVSIDEEGNEIVHLNEVFGVDGTIAGDRINLIKITIPQTLVGKIHVFPKSNFSVDGKAFIFGETNSPRIRGGFNLTNLSIPELLLTLRQGGIQFKSQDLLFNAEDLLLNGSDIQIQGKLNILDPMLINNLDVSSRYFNVDKLMTVAEKSMKYVPQSSGTTSSSSTSSDIPVTIKNGSINFAKIITGNIDVKNTTGRFALRRNIFDLRYLRANVFKGQVDGEISMDLISSLMNIKVSGQNVDVEQALLDVAGMKDTLSGTASFDTDISLKGATYEEQMKSLKGNVNFLVKNGCFGPFGKLENLIIAENIRESQFFQTALGGVISGLTTIDTTHFSELTGSLTFDDGVCHIDPITSLGNILSLHIFGDFDLLRNYADMKARARMASLVSNLLGPIGAINPANLINSATSLNVVTAKAFSIFCEMIPEDEISTLPSFANKYVDNSATKFQLGIRGDVAKPLTLIKSFKWLATETEYQNAEDYVNSIPEAVEGSEATNIQELIQEVEAEKKTFKYKVKHMFDKEDE